MHRFCGSSHGRIMSDSMNRKRSCDRKPTLTASMKHNNVKISHIRLWKNTPIQQCSILSVRIYFKGKTQETVKGWNSSQSVFRDATRLANLSAPLQNSSQKGTQTYKPPTPRKRSWWKQHTVVHVPPSHHHHHLLLLLTPWLSDLASSSADRLSLTMPPWVSDCAGRVAEKERKPIYNVVYTQPLPPPQTAPILGLMCGMHSFWVQFGHHRERERKRGQVCVHRVQEGVCKARALFARPLFESIVFRQLRFFMRGTIWRVLSECRAAAVFWGASFIDHRPGVGWWIKTHPPHTLLLTHHHSYFLQFLILP